MRSGAAREALVTKMVPLLWCAAVLCSVPSAGAEPVAGERGAPALVDRVIDQLDRSLVSRCLTPDVGRALSDVVASGALQPVLGSDLTLVTGDVRAGEIALEMRDAAQQSYAVTLVLSGTKAGTPDGQGQRFQFYLSPSATQNAHVRAALLATAALVDNAIPETAIGRCAGGGDQSQGDRRYPRALALASAVAELLVVLLAIAFGLRAIRVFAQDD